MNMSSHSVLAYLRSLVQSRAEAASDDRELLRRIGERRDDAFAVLLKRHGPMVLNSARRITGDEQLAEDVFQATFLLLSRKAHTIRRAEALPCWLHGVARRLAVQARRALIRRREREARVQPRSSADPLEELSARELVAVLDEEIGRLPESQRAVVILCCLEGLSQEEAARRLGCSVAAVKGRLERGRQRLRLRLEKRGLTLPAVLGGTMLLAGATSPVSAALAQTTLQAATRGGSPSAAVAALLEEAMRMMFVSKFKAIGAAVLLLAITGTGVGMMSLRPQGVRESAPPAAVDDKPLSVNKHVDLFGDPLPEGAVMRLGTIRRRAVGMTLAVTADGKSIVGARHCLCLNIWDAATGELRQKRELPEPWGTSILSPDGRWLAQWGQEALAIWDVRSVEKVRVLGAKEKRSFWPIAFSGDSKRIAAIGSREDKKGGHDHLLCAWNLAGGKEVFRTEVHHKHRGYRLALSPDGNRLLATFSSSSADKGLYCWDIIAGRQAWLNKEITSPESMVFTADGKVLTAPWGETVDLATGQTVKLENPPPLPLKGKGGGIYLDTQLALTPDGHTLLISNPENVVVWDMVHGKQRRRLEGAGEGVTVMPDGRSILTNDGSLQRWDLETGQPLWHDTFALGHIGKVNAVAFSADGKRLASIAADGSVRLWDVATGRPLRVWRPYQWRHPFYTDATVLDITPDGRWILAGRDGRLTLCDASSEDVARSIVLPQHDQRLAIPPHIFHLRIRAEGSRAVGLFGVMTNPPALHQLGTWDLKTGQMLTCHSIEPLMKRYSALSPEGRLLLHNGDLVDTDSGKKVARLESPPGYPWWSFSHDGALVLGNGIQTTDGLRVWESATGKVVAHLKPKVWIHQVAFHPNNRLLAINTNDGIHLYDAVTSKLLAVCRMPKDVMSSEICFDFSLDGRRLATGMPDGAILVWDASLPPSKPQRLEANEIESLWADLADADAAKAWRAVWRLSDAPNDALVLLRGHVKPYPTASADVMRKLLADLDNDSFKVRDAAAKRLKELSFQAEPALRAALKAKPSLEQRRRIEELLAAALPAPTPEELRQLRALIVLERIGTPEARHLLEEAAKGPPSARLTRQARSSLACIR